MQEIAYSSTASIGAGDITTTMLADNAVTNAKMADDAVKNAEVAADAAIVLSKLGNTGGAQGDVMYWNGTAWVRLAAGTSGYFLKTNGAAQNPAWANAAPKTKWISAAEFNANTATFQLLNSGTASIPILTFADGVTDASMAGFLIPSDYDGTTQLTIKLYWAPTTTNAGNIQWEIFLSWAKSGEAMHAATTSDTATQAGPGVVDQITVHTFTTSAQTFEVGDVLGIHVRRQGAHANDTATFNANLFGITIAWG